MKSKVYNVFYQQKQFISVMLLRESGLGKLGAISFSIRGTICFVLLLFLLPPMRLRFKINRGRANKKLIMEMSSL